MKAYKLMAVGDLQYLECEKPEISSGWVLLRVKAAGICSSDVSRVFIKGTYHFPTIPGHEFSGVVEEVADRENEYLIGKRAGIFPLIPCQKCAFCKNNTYELCENYNYLGSRRDGGFAEFVTVPVWNLILLPDSISFEEAAMLEPLAVAYHAVRRGKIKKGEGVAVIGTGMIGFAAARLIRLLYTDNIYVFGRNNDKLNIARKQAGVKYVSDFNDQNIFDTVIEAVGSEEAVGKSVSIVKPGGKIVLMGNPAGDITLKQDLYWKILRKQITVMGTWNSSFAEKGKESDWADILELVASKKINLRDFITHYFQQDELKKGLFLMYEHKEPYCKVMTLWNS